MKIKKAIYDYIKANAECDHKLEGLAEFIESFFHHIPEEYYDVAREFDKEISFYTWEPTMEEIEYSIGEFRKKDGVVSGMKWTLEEASAAAKAYNVENKIGNYNNVRFWIAMNYVYAVHYKLDRTTDCYIELAIDELCNKNLDFNSLLKQILE